MSYAANMDDELGGLDLDGLPPELREQAAQEKRSQGGYRFDSPADKQHIREQRGAIWAWLRGLGGNLIKHGVNLTKVPLPVELCEPRTFLQRLTDSWSYLDLLHAAAAAGDPVERLKLVVAFVVGGMRQQVSCDKPFNPILGETLQGTYACGCSVAAEQISHHPPVSCWQVRDHNGRFEFTGSSCWSATFTANSVKGSQTGECRLRFASDGATITWTLPAIHIRGVLFGDRVVKFHDTITFTDHLNGLTCELAIDPNAPKRGLVRRVLHKARHPRSRAHSHDALVGDLVRSAQAQPGGGSSGKGGKGGKGGQQQQLLDTCSGTWLTELVWDKGVRSTVLPESFEAVPVAAGSSGSAAAAATAAGGAGAGGAGGDDASVVCHSIGSFSSSVSGSTIADGEEGQAGDAKGAAGAAAAAHISRHAPANGTASAPHANGISASASSSEDGQPAQHPGCSASLTPSSLAAHTAAAGQQRAQQQQRQQDQQQHTRAAAAATVTATGAAAAPAAPVHVGSATTLNGSSDAAGHRSSRGIAVEKQLWAPGSSRLFVLQPLPFDDPRLLPSDCRFRPDVMALAARQRDAAQHWKGVLEAHQRADRALRGRHQHKGSEGGGGGQHDHARSSSRGSEALADAEASEPQTIGA